MLVAAAAAIGTLATTRPAAAPAPEKLPVPTYNAVLAPMAELCPVGVRETMHLESSSTIMCASGRKHETFVVARYLTTEPWERAAIIGADGRLVEMLDRPGKPGWVAEYMFVTDVNGDGVEEAFVGFASEWGRHRTDIIELRSGSVRFDYFSE
jgi:hypothetical protein